MVGEVHGDAWYGSMPNRSGRSSFLLCQRIRRKWPGGWRYAFSRMFRRRGGCRLEASSLIPWRGTARPGWRVPCSRGLNVPAVFLGSGHGIPGRVEAQCVADQPVLGLHTRARHDLLLISPHSDQSSLGQQSPYHRRRGGCCQACVAWELLGRRT
jgi:hypothetical protein